MILFLLVWLITGSFLKAVLITFLAYFLIGLENEK